MTDMHLKTETLAYLSRTKHLPENVQERHDEIAKVCVQSLIATCDVLSVKCPDKVVLNGFHELVQNALITEWSEGR